MGKGNWRNDYLDYSVVGLRDNLNFVTAEVMEGGAKGDTLRLRVDRMSDQALVVVRIRDGASTVTSRSRYGDHRWDFTYKRSEYEEMKDGTTHFLYSLFVNKEAGEPMPGRDGGFNDALVDCSAYVAAGLHDTNLVHDKKARSGVFFHYCAFADLRPYPDVLIRDNIVIPVQESMF